MDRWIDADDDIGAKPRGAPQGRVARMGIAGFVKSEGTMGTEGAQSFGKIEVVQSKREQRKAEATRLMPPPKLPVPAGAGTDPGSGAPPMQSVPAATGPPKCAVPPWAGDPPAGSRLLVYKDGQVIQDIATEKVVTVFGRVGELADVVLDHPSISRQHATIAFHPGKGAWLVTDLGSTHGTFVSDRRLAKNDPTELSPGAELRFAASTRRYKLPPAPARALAGSGGGAAPKEAEVEKGAGPSGGGGKGAGDMPPPPPPKRARVCFADGGGAGDGAGAGKAGTSGRPRPLETVIGFSDGRDFVARVGPKPVAAAEGKFAAAVATTIVVSPRHGHASSSASGGEEGGSGGALRSPHGSGGGGHGGAGAGHGGGGADGESDGNEDGRGAAEVQPMLKDFVERMRKEPPRAGSGSLYDMLPPPSR